MYNGMFHGGANEKWYEALSTKPSRSKVKEMVFALEAELNSRAGFRMFEVIPSMFPGLWKYRSRIKSGELKDSFDEQTPEEVLSYLLHYDAQYQGKDIPPDQFYTAIMGLDPSIVRYLQSLENESVKQNEAEASKPVFAIPTAGADINRATSEPTGKPLETATERYGLFNRYIIQIHGVSIEYGLIQHGMFRKGPGIIKGDYLILFDPEETSSINEAKLREVFGFGSVPAWDKTKYIVHVSKQDGIYSLISVAECLTGKYLEESEARMIFVEIGRILSQPA